MWTMMVTGLRLFAFAALQQTMGRLAKRPAALTVGGAP